MVARRKDWLFFANITSRSSLPCWRTHVSTAVAVHWCWLWERGAVTSVTLGGKHIPWSLRQITCGWPIALLFLSAPTLAALVVKASSSSIEMSGSAFALARRSSSLDLVATP